MLAILLLVAGPALAGPKASVTVHDTPVELPSISIHAPDGSRHGLEEFRGKAVVLDLWATWCLPCRAEFPNLDKLQARRGAEGVQVVPISLDRKGWPAVQKFYADTGVTNLPAFLDEDRTLTSVLGAQALPTTLILDRQGREVARVVGPLEWGGLQAEELLSKALASPSPASGGGG
ncbi:TlpA disulfide reductase family protein [Azospirillum sp. TSO22-1]|uniref:TlpA family protein disulfide reductase n=1 Tax=Azospirillum sp. TSO22-1 TaxID=716789 RepID=UPI001304EAFB|nr:TlpA disulfide reductase family protein [Azospirillum sp. TSO22-1]